jgi:hypothetical protein
VIAGWVQTRQDRLSRMPWMLVAGDVEGVQPAFGTRSHQEGEQVPLKEFPLFLHEEVWMICG